MKYRYLGSSGLLMARITLGTMTFGAEGWGCDEKTSHQIMRAYIDAGGNSIDCGDVYAGGRSEEIIGSFLPQVDRDELIIATKYSLPTRPGPNGFGASRKTVMTACEASLRRLKADYIDLYYLHVPDPITPFEEILGALDDLVRQSKVRYVGCSSLFAWQVAKARGVSDRLNLPRMVAGQYIYSLVHRELERELLPAALDSGMGITCFSPLGGGLLTGKYKDRKRPEGSRAAYRNEVDGPRFWHEKGFATAAVVEKVSAEFGIPIPRLAITWPLGRRAVTSVIIGVKNLDQLATNISAADEDLPAEVWAALEEQTRPTEEYMTWYNKFNYRRFFEATEFYNQDVELY
jgi:aryl-alcohol dehydrogenase-like predicted oxidoreductase